MPEIRHDLRSTDSLALRNARVVAETHRGMLCLRMERGAEDDAAESLAILPGPPFRDGRIDVTLAGGNAAGARADMRGFVGVAFRVQPDASRFELVFLRPLNARADDQLRRNHTTQYASLPDHPWHRLRAEAPGVYESYVDMEPDAWTRVRIEVDGTRARLFVHDAPQPCLVVNDLRHGASEGAVALWVGTDAVGRFADVRVRTRA